MGSRMEWSLEPQEEKSADQRAGRKIATSDAQKDYWSVAARDLRLVVLMAWPTALQKVKLRALCEALQRELKFADEWDDL